MDKELERVVELVGQKIDAKFREFTSNFMESMEIEETCREALEKKVDNLEGALATLTKLLSQAQGCTDKLEDAVMEESEEEDAEGDILSSSSLDADPVENMVAIPVLGPSVIHTLIPVETPLEYIPPSLQVTPCVRADCLATNTEYCDRCMHTTTQATNVARIKTKGNQGLARGTRWLG